VEWTWEGGSKESGKARLE